MSIGDHAKRTSTLQFRPPRWPYRSKYQHPLVDRILFIRNHTNKYCKYFCTLPNLGVSQDLYIRITLNLWLLVLSNQPSSESHFRSSVELGNSLRAAIMTLTSATRPGPRSWNSNGHIAHSSFRPPGVNVTSSTLFSVVSVLP